MQNIIINKKYRLIFDIIYYAKVGSGEVFSIDEPPTPVFVPKEQPTMKAEGSSIKVSQLFELIVINYPIKKTSLDNAPNFDIFFIIDISISLMKTRGWL